MSAIQIVVMGVTGVGKSTVGRLIAEAIGARFVDADNYHPPANVEKMRAGIPLDDHDRAPWLAALNALLQGAAIRGDSTVLACSALKSTYRTTLRQGVGDFGLVWLTGSRALIEERLAARRGHYMNPALLESQLATLEPPDDAVEIDIDSPPEVLARRARALAAGIGSTAPAPAGGAPTQCAAALSAVGAHSAATPHAPPASQAGHEPARS